MNIAQAKQLPLQTIVEHLGGRFSHRGRRGELWYFSPFRPNEKTASFKIDEKTNQWHDFARTENVDAHGDTLDLWTDFHDKPRRDSNAIKQALKTLSALSGGYHTLSKQTTPKASNSSLIKPPRYKFIKPPARIWIESLKQEITRRGLTLATVHPYLEQAYIKDTKTHKTYNGFAFKNDKGGYDISIPNPRKGEAYKTTIGHKAITVIGSNNYSTALLFEGFYDFLTYVQMSKGYEEYCYIVLNSASNINAAIEHLIKQKHTIHSVFSFLDNDPAGDKATHLLAVGLEPHGCFTFGTKNHLYENYKDLNEFWVKEKKAPRKSTPSNSRNAKSDSGKYRID